MCRADKKCVELCLDGHPEAFQKLVDRYQAPLLSYLTTRLGDETRAKEAAQEAFVRSYFGLKTLKKPASFSSSLFGIGERVAGEWQGRLSPRRKVANRLVLKCFPVRLTGSAV